MMVALSLTILALAPVSAPALVARTEARVSATITRGVILRADGSPRAGQPLPGIARSRSCIGPSDAKTAVPDASCRMIVYDLP